MRPNRRIATVFALGLLGANVFVLSGTAEAATTCVGEKATKVGTNSSETINGTSGDDVIVAKGGSDKINGRGGVDIICAGSGNDIISGGGGPDYIFGEGGNDTLKGGAWRDFLLGGPGNDTFKGGADPDTVWFDLAPGPVSVDLAAGTATGEGSDKLVSGIDAISGSQYGDTLAGNDGTNFFFGNDGDDTIMGLGDLDLITPGDGDDVVDGGTEDGLGFDLDIVYFTGTRAVTVNLQTGTATGLGTDDLSNLEAVYGSDGNDNITGDNRSNILFGGPGDDALDGGGGIALDYASYWFATAPVTANLQTGVAEGEGSDTLAGIEGLLGTIDYNDTLTGDGANNYLDGDGGNDILNGGGGDDLFLGGTGDDTMDGGAGDFDMADYFCGGCDLDADLNAGTIEGDGSDTVSGLEAVGADDGDDTLIGDEGDNYFYGWGGNDYIQGGGGDDKLDGGGGTNNLEGGAGNDFCTRYSAAAADCETLGTTPMADHPLRESAELVGTFRRNF